MTTLSDRLKTAMAAKGLRPADLARAAQVKPPSVSDWLSGKTKSIKGDNLLRVARTLDVDPTWLAHGVGAASMPTPMLVAENPSSYLTNSEAWPFKRINPFDYFEYLDTFQRAEIEGYISGLINAAKKTDTGNLKTG